MSYRYTAGDLKTHIDHVFDKEREAEKAVDLLLTSRAEKTASQTASNASSATSEAARGVNQTVQKATDALDQAAEKARPKP